MILFLAFFRRNALRNQVMEKKTKIYMNDNILFFSFQ